MLYTYGLDFDSLYSLADLDGLDGLVLDTSEFHGWYLGMVDDLQRME